MSEHIYKFTFFVMFSVMMALIGFNLGVTVTEEVDSECIEYVYKFVDIGGY